MISRLALMILAMLTACSDPEPEGQRLRIGAILGPASTQGFARAEHSIPFHFPADHGSHPAFRNEWWYLTGNLRTLDGRRFGYQVTFFRNALRPPEAQQDGSAWRTSSLWMAHVALTDVENTRHLARERFSRGAPGLAGAIAEPFTVWLEDWRLSADTAGSHGFPWQLGIDAEGFSLQFSLRGGNPVLQGDRGLSQKSAAAGNASYYYSFTRLATEGEVIIDGERHRVSGLSWFDREWSTSALAKEQSGWDWFALHMRDGESLMYYQLRRAGQAADPHSRGIWVDELGNTQAIRRDDIVLRELSHWRASDGTRYPVSWSLSWLTGGRDWQVKAVFDDQYMDLSIPYWEGAVDVLDPKSGIVVGQGYLEMTRNASADGTRVRREPGDKDHSE